MNCREVTNQLGETFELTEDEEKFLRALERISKLDTGRLNLFANGTISVRINDNWQENNIDASHQVYIKCEGGDGGD